MPRTAAPAALRLLNGRGHGTDSGGRKVPEAPGFKRTAPVKPDWLSDEASAEWDRVVPELLRLNITKEIDAACLGAYCMAVATMSACAGIIEREGWTIDARQGTLPHPAVGMMRKASADMRAWAARFGLTPSDEQKIKAAAGDDGGDDNPFA